MGMWGRRALRLLSLLALLLVSAEIASFLMLYALNLRDRAKSIDAEVNPAYQGRPWADIYWREHKQVISQGYEA